MLQVYTPLQGRPTAEKEEFYETLQTEMKKEGAY